MKLIIPKPKLEHTPAYFLRRAGYQEILDHKTWKASFVKPIHGGQYPRFHIYIEEAGMEVIINLHMDRQKSVLEHTTAHGGEYDGDVVQNEIARLKQLAGL